MSVACMHISIYVLASLSLKTVLSEPWHQLNPDVIYEGTTLRNYNYNWEGNNPCYSLPTAMMKILLTNLSAWSFANLNMILIIIYLQYYPYSFVKYFASRNILWLT